MKHLRRGYVETGVAGKLCPETEIHVFIDQEKFRIEETHMVKHCLSVHGGRGTGSKNILGSGIIFRLRTPSPQNTGPGRGVPIPCSIDDFPIVIIKYSGCGKSRGRVVFKALRQVFEPLGMGHRVIV